MVYSLCQSAWLRNIFCTSDRGFRFIEYAKGDTIGTSIKKHGRFEENVAKYFTSQILSGLAFLHSHGIVHGVSICYLLVFWIPTKA